MSFHTAHVPNMGYTALSVPLITPTHHTLNILLYIIYIQGQTNDKICYTAMVGICNHVHHPSLTLFELLLITLMFSLDDDPETTTRVTIVFGEVFHNYMRVYLPDMG